MRVGDQSTREQMGPLVFMPLEEIAAVYTAREIAVTTHQDCGDVIYLIPVEMCRASMPTLAIEDDIMVSYTTIFYFYHTKMQDNWSCCL